MALFSVRAADVPADGSHPYGHEKIEDMAAAIEGVLILVGSVVIAFEAVRHLIAGTGVQRLGVGIAVLARVDRREPVVSRTLSRRARGDRLAGAGGRRAHLRTDMLSSAGVLVALALVGVTGWDWLDPVVALVVAAVIAVDGRAHPHALLAGARRRDAARPRAGRDPRRGPASAPRGRRRLPQAARPPAPGARRHVDLHVQFRAGTTLEEAHRTAHMLQDAIRERLRDADVLIHLEPEDRVRPARRSEQVDRRRRADRQGDPRVALIAATGAAPPS